MQIASSLKSPDARPKRRVTKLSASTSSDSSKTKDSFVPNSAATSARTKVTEKLARKLKSFGFYSALALMSLSPLQSIAQLPVLAERFSPERVEIGFSPRERQEVAVLRPQETSEPPSFRLRRRQGTGSVQALRELLEIARRSDPYLNSRLPKELDYRYLKNKPALVGISDTDQPGTLYEVAAADLYRTLGIVAPSEFVSDVHENPENQRVLTEMRRAGEGEATTARRVLAELRHRNSHLRTSLPQDPEWGLLMDLCQSFGIRHDDPPGKVYQFQEQQLLNFLVQPSDGSKTHFIGVGVGDYSRFVGTSDVETQQNVRKIDSLYRHHAPTEEFESSLLFDSKATSKNVLELVRTTAARAGPNDVLVFNFSGHSDPGSFLLSEGTLDMANISVELQRTKAQKVVVILDTCHAGSFQKAASPDSKVTYLFSSEASGVAYGDRRGGVFTRTVVEALRDGAADGVHGRRDGQISLSELESFINPRMEFGQKPSFVGNPMEIIFR